MQIEPMPKDDGYRCWLSEPEQNRIADHYAEEPQRQLAIELMLDGLRSEEVPRVSKKDFRQLESEEEAWKLRVHKSKTGYRETPVSCNTRQRAVMLSNARGLRQDAALVDVNERSIQRWVKWAAEDIADETGDEDWNHVSAHDLRRSWATSTYYALNASDVAQSLVMRWGGWSDADTFAENYLGREPDELAAQMMEEAGLR
jgi:integrase